MKTINSNNYNNPNPQNYPVLGAVYHYQHNNMVASLNFKNRKGYI